MDKQSHNDLELALLESWLPKIQNYGKILDLKLMQV